MIFLQSPSNKAKAFLFNEVYPHQGGYKMRIFFQRIAIPSILLLALASMALAQDYQTLQNCQKPSGVEVTACRNNIEENKALTPTQKQMLEMRLSRFNFLQSIIEQAKQEQIRKVDASGQAEDTKGCSECQESPEQSK
jgi:hypothetical protein